MKSTHSEKSVSKSDNNAARLRLRAAWMYFVEGMTQNEVAEKLGVGRVTVLRMIAAAKEQNDVKISIDHEVAECVGLERSLELSFGIKEAIVVPLSSPEADAAPVIAAATGAFLSTNIHSGMKVGVGWGRTLMSSLNSIPKTTVEGLSVVSLLGGIMRATQFNPSEFAWRFGDTFDADCFLMTAPALVDSRETRNTLIEKCGLKTVFQLAEELDVVLLSVGGIGEETTYRRIGFISEAEQAQAVKQGAIGDMLLHFYDKHGDLVDSPLNDRVMSVPIDTLKKSPERILASGGEEKVEALVGAIKMISPTVLITDEWTAKGILRSV